MNYLVAVLIVLLVVSNYLWYVAFTSYRSEIKRQLRKKGF